MEKQKLSHSIVTTLSHEIGHALVPIEHLKSKLSEKGHRPTQSEIAAIFVGYERIERTLNKLRKLARDDFREAKIKTDRTGLINELVV